ncbi:type I toxin-antitoxin system Ibs family toxin [Citrobacter sp. TSA-1]
MKQVIILVIPLVISLPAY